MSTPSQQDNLERHSLERCKEILERLLSESDPETVQFVRDLLERYPLIAEIDRKSWVERWATPARDTIIEFSTTLIAKVLKN